MNRPLCCLCAALGLLDISRASAQAPYAIAPQPAYRETQRRIVRPVTETRYVDQQRVVYQVRWVTDQRETTQTTWAPVTTQKLVTRYRPGVTMLDAPVAVTENVPVTQWQPQTTRIKVPISRRELVPQTQTIRVPVAETRYVEETVVTRTPTYPVLSRLWPPNWFKPTPVNYSPANVWQTPTAVAAQPQAPLAPSIPAGVQRTNYVQATTPVAAPQAVNTNWSSTPVGYQSWRPFQNVRRGWTNATAGYAWTSYTPPPYAQPGYGATGTGLPPSINTPMSGTPRGSFANSNSAMAASTGQAPTIGGVARMTQDPPRAPSPYEWRASR